MNMITAIIHLFTDARNAAEKSCSKSNSPDDQPAETGTGRSRFNEQTGCFREDPADAAVFYCAQEKTGMVLRNEKSGGLYRLKED